MQDSTETPKRNGRDFGFDWMVYENGLDDHSTNFKLEIDPEKDKDLKMGDLILALRVATNAKKDLTVTSGSDSIRVDFLKQL